MGVMYVSEKRVLIQGKMRRPHTPRVYFILSYLLSWSWTNYFSTEIGNSHGSAIYFQPMKILPGRVDACSHSKIPSPPQLP